MTHPEPLTASEFEHLHGVEDWRVLDGAACAWFGAPSLTAGAALVRRIAAAADRVRPPDVDLRPGGVRVRIRPPDDVGLTRADVALAGLVSAAAQDLGMAADPSVLQRVRLGVDAADPTSVMSFWQTALGYHGVGDNVIADPLRRDPPISFGRLDESRPLRNRVHVDVVRAPEAVAEAKTALGCEAYGVYGLTLADGDGNEIDVVPGDEFPAEAGATDWRVLFGAMALYRTNSPVQAADLATLVAQLADQAGVPLLVDLRPDGVTIDSGKDQWEDEAQPAGTRFADLAGRIQAAARDLSLDADPTPLRFLQLGIDALDVPAVRRFWMATLGYRADPRSHLTDIFDPRRLDPVIIFQDLDASDDARRRQPNRIRLELVVPSDQAKARIDVAAAAGGRILASSAERCSLVDPEGNELDVVTQPIDEGG